LPEVSKQKKEADYYKTWHWIFRWVMVGRTNEAFRHAQWDMSRMRIQDIQGHRLTLPAITITPTVQGAGAAPGGTVPQPVQVNLNNRTLGEIFTSEKAVAYLLRIHVNSPGSALNQAPQGRAARAVRSAIINNPNLPNWNNPVAWTNAHETALTESLYTCGITVNDSISSTLPRIRAWRGTDADSAIDPNYLLRHQLGALRIARNSFHFDVTGI
jgi:hypothetical protein